MEGILAQLMIFLAILLAIVYAIMIVAAAIAFCGSFYGAYKALVCYGTALKRTYGRDEEYNAGKWLRAIVIILILLITWTAIVAFYYFVFGLNILFLRWL